MFRWNFLGVEYFFKDLNYFFSSQNLQLVRTPFNVQSCWWASNRGLLVPEMTTQPMEPPPMPFSGKIFFETLDEAVSVLSSTFVSTAKPTKKFDWQLCPTLMRKNGWNWGKLKYNDKSDWWVKTWKMESSSRKTRIKFWEEMVVLYSSWLKAIIGWISSLPRLPRSAKL